jgi:hypothetical protein
MTTATATRQDIRVERHGSLYLVYGLTVEARTWLVDNTQDGAIWWGDSLVVEGGYFVPLFDAMSDAGLVIR